MSLKKPIRAENVLTTSKKSLYPEPFASLMNGRSKRKLGDHFDLLNFGVNLTKLSPGAMSAFKHMHSKQDEFIYILSGAPTLVCGSEEYVLEPGECYGFKSDSGIAHHLVNKSENSAVYLEIGDRTPRDTVEYPENDLRANSQEDGTWVFLHKDGTPY